MRAVKRAPLPSTIPCTVQFQLTLVFSFPFPIHFRERDRRELVSYCKRTPLTPLLFSLLTRGRGQEELGMLP